MPSKVKIFFFSKFSMMFFRQKLIEQIDRFCLMFVVAYIAFHMYYFIVILHNVYARDTILMDLVLCDCPNDYCGLFEYVVSILSMTELYLLVMIIWCIYGACNNLLFRGQNSGLLYAKAQGILESFGKNDIFSVDCNLSSHKHDNV